jgi:hypothetical protein
MLLRSKVHGTLASRDGRATFKQRMHGLYATGYTGTSLTPQFCLLYGKAVRWSAGYLRCIPRHLLQ